MRIAYMLIIILFFTQLNGQSCCSAGTPLAGKMILSGIEKGRWRVAIGYDYNYLNSIYNGRKKVAEQLRTRISESLILNLQWGINSYFTFGVLASHNKQHRKSFLIDKPPEVVEVSGVGDIVISVQIAAKKITFLSPHQLEIGMGLKLPTGEHLLKNQGILLPPDLQPGTGSTDLIFLFYYARGYVPTSRISFTISSTVRLTGQNSLGYEYGNEWFTNFNLQIKKTSFIAISSGFEFRNISKEKRSGHPVANTGGYWVNFIPDITLFPSESMMAHFYSQLPVFRKVGGIQLTTTYRIGIRLSYLL
ncbi:MAG: hypothetical protein Kow00108_24100 [Calditrichia bacterium]